RAGERAPAPARRRLDRLRGRTAPRLAACRPRRRRPRRRAHRGRRQPRRDCDPLAREPHEPERPRRLPARRDRPGRVCRDGDRRRARPRNRLEPLRPDREPARRRADVLGELRAAARVDRDLPRARARGDRPCRGRARDRRRAAGRRGARPPRLDGRKRLSGAVGPRPRRAGVRLPRAAPAARDDARRAVRSRPHDAAGRPRHGARRGAGRAPLVPLNARSRVSSDDFGGAREPEVPMKGARGGTLVPPRDLRLPEAGSAAIRGGALRTGGYLTGTALIAAASVLLLRHLGVTDFGRYVTVMSLVAVVSGLTVAGLTLVGQREYVVAPTPEAKRDLLANVLGIRLAVAPVGIGLAALFALAAGYTTAMTLGTLLAGSGLMLAFAAHTLTTPLTTSLRLGALTITELARDAVMFAGIGLLVLAGAGLLPFFTPHIAAGAIQLGLTLALVGAAATRPRFAFARWWPLIREAAPVGAALIVNVLYLR